MRFIRLHKVERQTDVAAAFLCRQRRTCRKRGAVRRREGASTLFSGPLNRTEPVDLQRSFCLDPQTPICDTSRRVSECRVVASQTRRLSGLPDASSAHRQRNTLRFKVETGAAHREPMETLYSA